MFWVFFWKKTLTRCWQNKTKNGWMKTIIIIIMFCQKRKKDSFIFLVSSWWFFRLRTRRNWFFSFIYFLIVTIMFRLVELVIIIIVFFVVVDGNRNWEKRELFDIIQYALYVCVCGYAVYVWMNGKNIDNYDDDFLNWISIAKTKQKQKMTNHNCIKMLEFIMNILYIFFCLKRKWFPLEKH